MTFLEFVDKNSNGLGMLVFCMLCAITFVTCVILDYWFTKK